MNTQKRRSIEEQAEKILRDSDAYRVPVVIDRVTQQLGLTAAGVGMEDDISGLLVIENGKAVIGYNPMHAPVRQRFTIAHEIGHYVLHVKELSHSRLFVDKYVVYRDDDSSKGSDQEEVEANTFAAALLMPERLVRQEIKRFDLDLDSEDDISDLAKRFNVSPSAISNRLVNLGLLR